MNDRKQAVLEKLKSYGGWPYGISKITVDVDCRVFFDNIYMRDFIDKYKPLITFNNVTITENDYRVYINDQS